MSPGISNVLNVPVLQCLVPHRRRVVLAVGERPADRVPRPEVPEEAGHEWTR